MINYFFKIVIWLLIWFNPLTVIPIFENSRNFQKV